MNQEPFQESRFSTSDLLLDAAAADLDAAKRLRFTLHQRFTYRYTAPVRNVVQRLAVLPPISHGGQRRTFQELSVRAGESSMAWSRDEFANDIAQIHVPVVTDAVEFQFDALLERTGTTPVTLPSSALRDRRYIQATTLTEADDGLRETARNLAGSRAAGPELAARICAYVHSTLPYRKHATSVCTTAVEAVRIGAGVCQDHAHVMLALCRALALPARYVSGHMLGEGSTHAWVEVLVPHPSDDTLAIALPFDPCHGRAPGASYVTVAVGRDYSDVAPASGTYSGSASNQLNAVTRLGVTILE